MDHMVSHRPVKPLFKCSECNTALSSHSAITHALMYSCKTANKAWSFFGAKADLRIPPQRCEEVSVNQFLRKNTGKTVIDDLGEFCGILFGGRVLIINNF